MAHNGKDEVPLGWRSWKIHSQMYRKSLADMFSTTSNSILEMERERSDHLSNNDEERCWIRMPTGCSKTLNEIQAYNIYSGNRDTGWFQIEHNWDRTEDGCLVNRKTHFDAWCMRNDALAKVSSLNLGRFFIPNTRTLISAFSNGGDIGTLVRDIYIYICVCVCLCVF